MTNHPPRPCPPAQREVVLHDEGGWISGPSLDVPERPLSTREKLAAALAVECPVHHVAPGAACPPGSLDGACMARRKLALPDQ